jgi:LacI family transcriptional regulator
MIAITTNSSISVKARGRAGLGTMAGFSEWMTGGDDSPENGSSVPRLRVARNAALRKSFSRLRRGYNDGMDRLLRVGLVCNYHLAYTRGVLRGVTRWAQARPRWVFVPIDTDKLTAAALRSAGVDGAIAQVITGSLADTFREWERPLVNVASVLPGLPFPRVVVDHRLVGGLAAGHLLERGFRHFGFVGHPRHLYSTEREAGFRRALSATGGSVACYYERPARSYQQRGRLLALDPRLQRWLRDLPKPAGVFACHDVWALQVVEACRLGGLRVPEEVAVVGVDNDDLICELARPSLSSVVVPAERVGYEAAALLERLLAGEPPPRDPVLLPPPGVVARQSSDVLAIGDPDVAAALRYLRDHAHAPLRVADVLRAVPISRRALERRFRALLGRGLAEEIRRVRVERAKHLLATTELRMAEVTERAGFASQPQLSRVFRRETGLTPTAFRRRVRNPAGLSG